MSSRQDTIIQLLKTEFDSILQEMDVQHARLQNDFERERDRNREEADRRSCEVERRFMETTKNYQLSIDTEKARFSDAEARLSVEVEHYKQEVNNLKAMIHAYETDERNSRRVYPVA